MAKPNGKTDFATWQRSVLEKFCRECATENKELRDHVEELTETNKVLLEQWRVLVKKEKV